MQAEAASVSIAIHILFFMLAGSIVAVRWLNKPEAEFTSENVERPKLERRKLQMPVRVKKMQRKSRRPAIKNRLTFAKSTFRPTSIKAVGLVAEGFDYNDAESALTGLASLGFSIPNFNLFGTDKSAGNELEGIFFDLKMKPDRSPAKMDEKYYITVLKDFVRSWNINQFKSKYFQAPRKKFATVFMMPYMSAEEAPKAFGVADVVKPKQWVAYYKGKIAAPQTGRYRFWGIADDVLMVRIRKKLVLDANWPNLKITDWESKDPNNRRFKLDEKEKELAIGDWVRLYRNKPTDIEVLVGERPGGRFYCRLLIEQEGVEYPKREDGMLILPVFKTVKTIPPKLVEKMEIKPNTCTLEGPSFGVLK